MNKNKLLRALLVFVLSITIAMVHAQHNTTELSGQQQGLVKIAASTATGNMDQLHTAFHKSLDAGLTQNEIKEALVQLYAYTGFPRSLNAIQVLMSVVDERKRRGIVDATGQAITVNSSTKDKYEQGRKVLEELTQTTQAKPAPGFGEFAPRLMLF